MTSRSDGSERLLIIEYLRGLAALSVAWFHLTNTYGPNWVSLSGSMGWLGVEVFFVISGFIIPYSISILFPRYTLKDFPSFVLRRILRLEPPYLVSVALTLFLWQMSAFASGFRGAIPQVDPLQASAHVAYLIPLTDYTWYQPVYWTLAYEFAFYLVIGLVFPFLCAPNRRLVWFLAVTASIGFVCAGLTPHRILLFVMGIAAFRAFRDPSETSMTVFVILCSTGVIALFDLQIAAVGLITAAIIHVYRHFKIGGAFGWTLLGLGSISYSLYLTHIPIGGRVVNLGRRWIDGAVGELALSLAALAACITFAHFFRRFVETPAIRLARSYTAEQSAAAR